MSATAPESTQKNQALLWIGAFKLGKGLLLLVLATGLLSFVHRDVEAFLLQVIDQLHFDPENRYIATLLDKAGLLDARKIGQLSALTFFYSAIFLTEGVGLMLRKRWAEFLTVIATASLIPIEIFETCKHFGPIKLALLAFNAGIVWFLIRVLKRQSRPKASVLRSAAATAA